MSALLLTLASSPSSLIALVLSLRSITPYEYCFDATTHHTTRCRECTGRDYYDGVLGPLRAQAGRDAESHDQKVERCYGALLEGL